MNRYASGRAFVTVLAFVAASSTISGCSGLPPLSTAGSFAIDSYFDGASRSEGEIDTLFFWRETFTARFVGHREETGEFALDETFQLRAGERLQSWRLQALPDGRYEGTVRTADRDGLMSPASPVAGYRTAEGAVLDYDGYAPGGGSMLLHFRHIMTDQRDGIVLNRVEVSKFGIPLAKAHVVFSKVPSAGLPSSKDKWALIETVPDHVAEGPARHTRRDALHRPERAHSFAQPGKDVTT